MLIDYDNFDQLLSERIKLGTEFNYDTLKKIIDYPERYTGIFRASNVQTKLIQNITQSREIKFGDFMEDIVTQYIDKMGYKNLPKIVINGTGESLSTDQLFENDDTIYLIEQKIRDDHDSTKKVGQFDNFHKKYTFLEETYPNKDVVAIMWFIDGTMKKNKNYYIRRAEGVTSRARKHIFYGSELFEVIFKRTDVWQEITSHLERNKAERRQEILTVDDPDTGLEMLEALRLLKETKPNYIRKLLSDDERYVMLRKELFPTGDNLSKLLL